jgi:hypothetical protein
MQALYVKRVVYTYASTVPKGYRETVLECLHIVL